MRRRKQSIGRKRAFGAYARLQRTAGATAFSSSPNRPFSPAWVQRRWRCAHVRCRGYARKCAAVVLPPADRGGAERTGERRRSRDSVASTTRAGARQHHRRVLAGQVREIAGMAAYACCPARAIQYLLIGAVNTSHSLAAVARAQHRESGTPFLPMRVPVSTPCAAACARSRARSRLRPRGTHGNDAPDGRFAPARKAGAPAARRERVRRRTARARRRHRASSAAAMTISGPIRRDSDADGQRGSRVRGRQHICSGPCAWSAAAPASRGRRSFIVCCASGRGRRFRGHRHPAAGVRRSATSLPRPSSCIVMWCRLRRSSSTQRSARFECWLGIFRDRRALRGPLSGATTRISFNVKRAVVPNTSLTSPQFRR